jgi:formate dehydrogenase maturation protein FdhE
MIVMHRQGACVKSTPETPDPTPNPTICPFCGSAKISVPRTKVTASTYWRCEACDQMWNVSRQKASAARSFGGRWNGSR